jgi:uroporphyrinogen III methyltransferase/synthase
MKVYLVGAGPGGADLITVRGRNLLSRADVVIGDYLADRELLSWMKPDAEYIYAGKREGKHTLRQEDIEKLLIEKAREGQMVVRLKGGDPFVFGRGGEEIEALHEAGIPFEVVPGVTSAIAGPAAAGIPVTHRGVSSSFSVITGHEDPAKPESSLRWEHLANGADTLVFLMAMSHIREIAEKLIACDRPADTPAAFIRWACRPSQVTWVTTLGKAASLAEEKGIKPPCIFIVGRVVNLRPVMQWFDNRPLFGKRIVITRSASQSSSLHHILTEWGAECICLPAIQIEEPPDHYEALDRELERIGSYQWIVFTSQNGVDHVFRRLFARGMDTRALGHAKIAAIGTATAEALQKYGIRADLVPHSFCAEGLADAIGQRLNRGEKILIPRAAVARPVLKERLSQLGGQVTEVPAYMTCLCEKSRQPLQRLLTEHRPHIITFTSSSTVKNLLRLIDGRKELLEGIQLAAIGPITAATMRKLGLTPALVAHPYTVQGLAEKIREEVISHES